MYVLQHADQPELYANLPKDPSISPLVGLWKGIAKPLMNLGVGLAVFAGFFHFVTVGPKEVEEEEGEIMSVFIQRYTARERSNHWVVAIAFVLPRCRGWRCFTRPSSFSPTCSAAAPGPASCIPSSAC